jgi:hypothetical protein
MLLVMAVAVVRLSLWADPDRIAIRSALAIMSAGAFATLLFLAGNRVPPVVAMMLMALCGLGAVVILKPLPKLHLLPK